ncbi:MAG: DUF4038 domain-containing protein [Chitinivibrionales bacterium]|nr:DUF4038 domain-containing protein [Chitinivibrionales bacterium]
MPVPLPSTVGPADTLAFLTPAEETHHVSAVNIVTEWRFHTQSTPAAPYNALSADARVTYPDGSVRTVPLFWAGGNEWRLRFASPLPGRYDIETVCSDPGECRLHGRQRSLDVLPYGGPNELLQHGPIQPDPQTGRLRHADGTPFFWLADSWWHGMSARLRWPRDFKTLAADRAQKGFTVIQFAVGFGPDVPLFDRRSANEAGHPFTRDLTSINPAYFDHVDRRVRCLLSHGLVPNVVGCWAYAAQWLDVAQLKRYWRYLIARYGAFPLVWTLAGEVSLAWYLVDKSEHSREAQRQCWSDVARYVRDTDPYGRILTAHPGPHARGTCPLDDFSLLDMLLIQPGHSGYETLPEAHRQFQALRRRCPTTPLLAGEVCFEGMHGDCREKVQRILFWSLVLSGAAGHSYGAEGIWQLNAPDDPFGPSPLGHAWSTVPWQESYRWPGSAHVGMGRKILDRYPWWLLEPHQEWVSPAADATEPLDAYAAGIPGHLRLVYFPRKLAPWGRRYRIVRLEPGLPYEATFVNPMTGQEHALGVVTGDLEGNWQVPVAPVLHDWLLVLRQTGDRA